MYVEQPHAQGRVRSLEVSLPLVSACVVRERLVLTLQSIVKKVAVQNQIGNLYPTYASVDVPGLMTPETAVDLAFAADSGAIEPHSSQPSFCMSP